MIKGTTESGFEFEIPENTLNNMEVIDLLRDVQKGEDGEIGEAEMLLALSGLVDFILGKQGKKKLYNHVRTEDGRVPIEAVMTEIMGVFAAAKAGN